jgi:hypothetical protein
MYGPAQRLGLKYWVNVVTYPVLYGSPRHLHTTGSESVVALATFNQAHNYYYLTPK